MCRNLWGWCSSRTGCVAGCPSSSAISNKFISYSIDTKFPMISYDFHIISFESSPRQLGTDSSNCQMIQLDNCAVWSKCKCSRRYETWRISPTVIYQCAETCEVDAGWETSCLALSKCKCSCSRRRTRPWQGRPRGCTRGCRLVPAAAAVVQQGGAAARPAGGAGAARAGAAPWVDIRRARACLLPTTCWQACSSCNACAPKCHTVQRRT